MTADLSALSADTLELAAALSPATRIEPELIRAIRLRVLPHLTVDAESEFWFSDLADIRSPHAITLRPQILTALRERLVELLTDAAEDHPWRQIGSIIQQVHASITPALQLEERVTWQALANPHDTSGQADEQLETALRALVEGRQTGVADWFVGAWERLPQSVKSTRMAWQLSQAVAGIRPGTEALHGSAAPSGLTVGDVSTIVEFLDDIQLGVRRDVDGLVVGEDVGGPLAISVPDTNPRVLELTEGAEPPRSVPVPEGETVQIQVGAGDVRVKNARGEIFDLAGLATSQASGAGERADAPGVLSIRLLLQNLGATAAIAYSALSALGALTRFRPVIVEQIGRFFLRRGARFERRYRQLMLGALRFIEQKGLATVGPFAPELDAVFVSVRLLPRPPHQIGPGIISVAPDDLTGPRVLEDFLGRAEPAVLAVVGPPGSGKTALLRHVARQACLPRRSRRSRGVGRRDIPILLYLRDHYLAITNDPAVSVADLLRTTLGVAAPQEPQGWFEQQLQNGRCLVLLDGLDEVARQEDQSMVSAWAESQIARYPGNDFVISSRPQGYQLARLAAADVVQVCGFTASQVKAFVHGWYRAAERFSRLSSDPDVDLLAEQGADDLLRRLWESPALYDLSVNPLLLTMIVNVHRYRAALPGSRADLYREICQVMLWRQQEAKNLRPSMGGEQKEAVLRRLAYVMMKRRVADVSRADVTAVIAPSLTRLPSQVSPDEFLVDVSSSGLFLEREVGRYAFAHRTFQEYLAAAHVREAGLVGELAETVGDAWWAETTLLYAAMSNADPIIQACLNDNSASALALALDCTEQDSDIDPGLRRRLSDLVSSAAATGADRERRRLFAGVLLSRYARERQRTDYGAEVCIRPVPADIYRLFLADTQVPEPDAILPDSGIAVGMRGSDAAAFVEWANAMSGAERSYRLPEAAEVAELAARQRVLRLPSGPLACPWVRPDQTSSTALPRIWVPAGASDPHEVPAYAVIQSVTEDFDRLGITQLSSDGPGSLRLTFRDISGEYSVLVSLDLARRLVEKFARDRKTATSTNLEALAAALTRAAGIDDTSFTVPLDTMPSQLASAVARLPSSLLEESLIPWNDIAAQLAKTALPVLNRTRPPEPHTAAISRLIALLMASAAGNLHQGALADTFRNVAAAITLLERRLSEEQPAAEVIELAVE